MKAKTRLHLVVIMPAVLTVILGSLLTLVLILATTTRAHSADMIPSGAGVTTVQPKTTTGSTPSTDAAIAAEPKHVEGAVAGSPPVAAVEEPAHVGIDGSVGGAAATPPCDFPQFVGKAPDTAALDALKRPYRVLKPGSVATMDYSADRIDVKLDDAGIVTSVTCG